jgi:large subunit ribosomal protein L17
MRHRKHHGSLGLNTGHRRAVLANLATALLTHGSIKTTEAKARAIRPYVEKLITLGKRGDLHARRQALAKLRYRSIVDRLFNDVAPGYAERNGGYTRIIKTGFRVGDAAKMAIIELVEQGSIEVKKVSAEEAKKETKKAAKSEKKAEAKEAIAEEVKAEKKTEARADDAEAGEESKDKS